VSIEGRLRLRTGRLQSRKRLDDGSHGVGLFHSLKNMFGGGDAAGKGLKRIEVKKRFDLLSRTGQGSMSMVWRARDRETGRTVCLKLLDKVKTAKFEARFPGVKKPQEGAICIGLKHKNIVQTFEHGMTTDGAPYLVMELVDGMGFNFLVENKSPQLNGNRVNFLAQLADSVEYFHKQGYVHRDICPRNAMVTKDGVVKLIDFGLAIPNKAEFLRPGNRTGTPDYLAPEIIRRNSTDQRVDLFALGVTAFEVFTFNLPWEKHPDSMQTFLNHINNPGRDPREFKPDLDKRTVDFLIKSVERDPKDRFQTAAAFRDAVQTLPESH
jgi:serine/threonine protein kinase